MISIDKANEVRRLRDRGHTIKAISAKANVSYETVRRIVNNEWKPSPRAERRKQAERLSPVNHRGELLGPESYRHPAMPDVTAAEAISRLVAIELSRHHYSTAVDIIKRAEADHLATIDAPQRDILDLTLHELGLCLQTISYLEDNGILTVKALLHTPREKLERIVGMGEGRVAEVLHRVRVAMALGTHARQQFARNMGKAST